MRLGLSSYTYTWAIGVPGSIPANPLSATELIDHAFNAGLRLIQIADNLHLEKLPGEELDRLFNYAARKDVSIEMGGRGLTPDQTMKCFETAEKIKSPPGYWQ